MKKLYLLTILTFSSVMAFSQKDTTIKEEIFTIVEQMPSFPGGDAEMGKWIRDKMQTIGFHKAEKEAGISGKCYVSFVIDKEGNVTGAHIIRGIDNGPGYDKLALQVVNEMPKWIPGKQNGKLVSVQYNLPINFKNQSLQKDTTQ